MSGYLIEIHAREKAGMPDTWRSWLWERVGPPEAPYPFIRLTGAVVPLLTRGPRKGKPNWRRKDKATERVVTITPDEHDAWATAWQARTGKCRDCMGEGRRPWSSSARDGTTYRSCKACEGTGVPAGMRGATVTSDTPRINPGVSTATKGTF